MRSLVALPAVALLAAALVPAPFPAVAAPADQAGKLLGSWTCRDPRGRLTQLAFSADGTGLVARETAPGAGAEVSPPQRYVPAKAGWLVTSVGESRTFSGSAPAWTGATWDIDGREFAAPPAYAPQSVPERISYERVDANTIRRTVAYGPEHRVVAARSVPAVTSRPRLRCVPPTTCRPAWCGRSSRTRRRSRSNKASPAPVKLLVSLDVDGTPVTVRVRESPSAILNSSAISPRGARPTSPRCATASRCRATTSSPCRSRTADAPVRG